MQHVGDTAQGVPGWSRAQYPRGGRDPVPLAGIREPDVGQAEAAAKRLPGVVQTSSSKAWRVRVVGETVAVIRAR
jgi:hypothetical protein